MARNSWEDQETGFPPPTHPIFQGLREQEEKPVFQRHSLERRVPERQFGTRSPGTRWEPWDRMRGYNPEDDELDTQESRKIVLQVIGAAILVLATYVVFQSGQPYAEKAQQAVRMVMQKETDFSAVTTWVQTHLGEAGLAVPTLAPAAADPVPSAEDVSFVYPLAQYKITQNYDAAKHPAILMSTTPSSEIKTVSKGSVLTVDRNEKYGVYVIVDHGGAWGQTLYGHLDSAAVKPGDWLYTGQTIGKAAKQEPADLYFAYRKKDKFVDPQEILKRATN